MANKVVYFNNESVLVFILRVIRGLLFLFPDCDKVFKVKIDGVTEYLKNESRPVRIPEFILKSYACCTSYTELIGGAFLILGLFKNYVLYLLGFALIVLVGEFSLLKPMWVMNLLFPTLVLFGIFAFFTF